MPCVDGATVRKVVVDMERNACVDVCDEEREDARSCQAGGCRGEVVSGGERIESEDGVFHRRRRGGEGRE